MSDNTLKGLVCCDPKEQDVIKEKVTTALLAVGLSEEEVGNVFTTLTPQEIINKYMWHGDAEIPARVCTTCGGWMFEGFCIESGEAYYCSEKCMREDGMTMEEYNELYDKTGDTYYTSWYE